ncbi:MAG: hypothetical protein V4649_10620 [Bacteroidota bacterium]
MASAGLCIGQQSSYLYIQGDKKTPFYVKVDGRMAARYGKNHCILPVLHAGNMEIEILYQQNIYPPQAFTIAIPEHGHKAYMLNRQGNGYNLYDLEAKTYLDPNPETEKKKQ